MHMCILINVYLPSGESSSLFLFLTCKSNVSACMLARGMWLKVIHCAKILASTLNSFVRRACLATWIKGKNRHTASTRQHCITLGRWKTLVIFDETIASPLLRDFAKKNLTYVKSIRKCHPLACLNLVCMDLKCDQFYMVTFVSTQCKLHWWPVFWFCHLRADVFLNGLIKTPHVLVEFRTIWTLTRIVLT